MILAIILVSTTNGYTDMKVVSQNNSGDEIDTMCAYYS